MKQQPRILAASAVLLALFALAGVAQAKTPANSPNSLSLSGTPVAPSGPIHIRSSRQPAALVNDGSFENGPPPTSAWTEVTDVACEWIGDWSSVWGAAAYDGSMDFWAGGYCSGVPATSSVTQAGIAVPVSDNDLHFWYLAYRTDADDAALDTATVSVNGTPVWTLNLTVANSNFPVWAEVVVPLAAYAGTNVTLRFEAVSAGTETGNIRYDYITIGTPPPPPPRCPVGSAEVTVLPLVDFEGAFPPAGWALANSTTGCVGSADWTNTDPGARGNLTSGTGLFAVGDSDACGSGVAFDAEMSSPAFDLTGLSDPEVTFAHNYNDIGGADTATVDVRVGAANPWVNVHTWIADASGSYTTPIAGAGQADVSLRWHYVAGWDWWWEVDEVVVTACQAGAGCTLTPPVDITVPAQGPTGAIVDYVVGASAGCGVVTCVPPSGSLFPVGTTQVTCTSELGGGATSFNVTVLAVQQSIIEVPTLAPFGLAGLTLLLAGAAVVLLRRRRA